MLTALFCGLLVVSPAHAKDAEEAPEFLLGDVGVRLDLEPRWHMTRWSDWDFKAETRDKSMALFAWTTPIQSLPAEADLEAWGELYADKAVDLGGSEPEVVDVHLETHQDLPTAQATVNFSFGGGARMVLQGAAVPVEGQVFHVANVGARRRAERVEAELDAIVDAMEIHRPPAEPGPRTVEVSGIQTPLPEGFRVPQEGEMSEIAPRLAQLGIETPEDCLVAIRPHGPDLPDLLATCQGGLWLGIVDEYSFADKEEQLRPTLFGPADVPPATPVDLPDRTGFHYAPDLGDNSLRVGVVPYDQGLARTWLIGLGDHAEDHPEVLETVMRSSTYSGEHPVSLVDRAQYLVYRPVWLGVAGGVGLLLLAGLGLGLAAALNRGGNKYEDFD